MGAMSQTKIFGTARSEVEETAPERRTAITTPALESADGVRRWFRLLDEEGYCFHPEESFKGMVDGVTEERCFTDAEAARMDLAMRHARLLVDDVCTVALETVRRPEAMSYPGLEDPNA